MTEDLIDRSTGGRDAGDDADRLGAVKIRAALALALPLLVGASVPTLDVNRGVELVNAAPSDFRAGLAALFLLLCVQTLERWLGGRRADKNAAKVAESDGKLVDAVTAMTTQLAAMATELRELARGRA